jgi:hypothetical protein
MVSLFGIVGVYIQVAESRQILGVESEFIVQATSLVTIFILFFVATSMNDEGSRGAFHFVVLPLIFSFGHQQQQEENCEKRMGGRAWGHVCCDPTPHTTIKHLILK